MGRMTSEDSEDDQRGVIGCTGVQRRLDKVHRHVGMDGCASCIGTSAGDGGASCIGMSTRDD